MTTYVYEFNLILISTVLSDLVLLHCVSKNAPTLTSCRFDKYDPIFIIFGRHQHTIKSDMHVQLSLSLDFYLFYLFLRWKGRETTRFPR